MEEDGDGERQSNIDCSPLLKKVLQNKKEWNRCSKTLATVRFVSRCRRRPGRSPTSFFKNQLMLLTGLIHTIFHEEKYGNDPKKQFRKTVVWLQEINAQYPNTWSIEFWNDDKDWLRGYATGQLVSINIAVLGRKTTKNGQEMVFNTIRATKITRIKTAS